MLVGLSIKLGMIAFGLKTKLRTKSSSYSNYEWAIKQLDKEKHCWLPRNLTPSSLN
jgi:hypothetical protein